MHGSFRWLDALVAKLALGVLGVVAFLLALLCVWLVLRKTLKNKPLKTKLVVGCLVTPMLTLVFAVVIIWIGWFALLQFVIKPENKRRCVQGMQAIADASRKWAADHGGRLPQDVLSLSNYLASPQVLICPATGRFTDGSYRLADVSYELAAPGATAQDTNVLFLRCVVHPHRAYTDGRVVDDTAHR
ncbi:MAG: hypothetical protein M9920_07770 [Verrucomicrobiae bacterium]|nr:hypothetical protein [Verrucomicrobiae bacterium]